ncbi:MAG TPA: ATP-dependent Clp protease adaptor ClpS [Methanosarcina sp.]|nr:ATP-dependent Clp protease adaptor ClpS [Methanosarcina sp.]
MSDTMSKTKVVNRERIQPKLNIPEPPQYRVIYINDETTTQEFVVETLKIIFNYDEGAAITITMKVHEEGSAVVAVLPYEIAEQKGIEVTMLARSNNFPLQVKIEPDN